MEQPININASDDNNIVSNRNTGNVGRSRRSNNDEGDEDLADMRDLVNVDVDVDVDEDEDVDLDINGIDDRVHADEDHQSLNNQVNEYFQHIKNYTSGHVDVDVDVDDVVNGVDFGVDLDIHIDSLTDYSTHTDATRDSSAEHSRGNKQVEMLKKPNSTSTSTSTSTPTPAPKSKSNPSPIRNPIRNPTPTPTLQSSASTKSLTNLMTKSSAPTATDINKRACQFCGKTFQHAGSLGRHLDNQKGNELHPLEEIEKIRSNVARRGDPEAVRLRRIQRSKEYNRREYVKEKNRMRRKASCKLTRIRESFQMKFSRQINHPVLPLHPSFPRLVLFFLPPNTWPYDPPTIQTFKTLVLWIQNNKDVNFKIPYLFEGSSTDVLLEKLTISFETWQALSLDDKREMWIREQRVISQELLGNLTVFDFAIRDNWAKHLMEEKKVELMLSESNSTTTAAETENTLIAPKPEPMDLSSLPGTGVSIRPSEGGHLLNNIDITSGDANRSLSNLQSYYTTSQNETDETNETDSDDTHHGNGNLSQHDMDQLTKMNGLDDMELGSNDDVDHIHGHSHVKMLQDNSLVDVAEAAVANAASQTTGY